MNLLLRMIRVLLLARFRGRINVFDETSIRFRVWPTDLDVLWHMNNGRYLTLMDLGRIDAFIRAGAREKWEANGWYPVVASETIRFRESLPAFATFELRTQLLGWDERSFYSRQTFVRRGKIVAIAVVRARFLKKSGGTLHAAEVAAALMPGVSTPSLPDYIRNWGEAEEGYSK